MLTYTHPSFPLVSVFDRFFDDFRPLRAVAAPGTGNTLAFSPRVDIRNDKEHLVLALELPGVDSQDVAVKVYEGILTISGEKKAVYESEEKDIHRSERIYGAFQRSFNLPDWVDDENIVGEHENGVLTLKLAKRPEAEPRLIPINEVGSAKKAIAGG